MYVNVAVLKETQPHERRVALVPSVVGKLVKLGAKPHMQSGAGDAGLVTASRGRPPLVRTRGLGTTCLPPSAWTWSSCLGEPRYGHLYLRSSRSYQFTMAGPPLSSSPQNALSKKRLYCRS
jgi:Alanine dehydrogenase/PNT, N-terminal domain